MRQGQRDSLDHNRVRALLSPFVDGELTPQERAAVERHLARCQECARELESLRWTVSLLRQVPAARVPRSFAVPAPGPARRRGLLGRLASDRAYGFLRAATALVTILLVIVVSVDVLGLSPLGAPGGAVFRAPAAPMPQVAELPVEMPTPAEEIVPRKEAEKPLEKEVAEAEKRVAATAVAPTEAPEALSLKEVAPAVVTEEGARALALPGTPVLISTPSPQPRATSTVPPPPPPHRDAAPSADGGCRSAEAAVTPPAPPVVAPVPAAAGPDFLRRIEISLLVAIVVLAALTLAVGRRRSGS